MIELTTDMSIYAVIIAYVVFFTIATWSVKK